MALVLEISPEAEARLRMYAAKRGQDLTEYLLMLIKNDSIDAVQAPMTQAEAREIEASE